MFKYEYGVRALYAVKRKSDVDVESTLHRLMKQLYMAFTSTLKLIFCAATERKKNSKYKTTTDETEKEGSLLFFLAPINNFVFFLISLD